MEQNNNNQDLEWQQIDDGAARGGPLAMTITSTWAGLTAGLVMGSTAALIGATGMAVKVETLDLNPVVLGGGGLIFISGATGLMGGFVGGLVPILLNFIRGIYFSEQSVEVVGSWAGVALTTIATAGIVPLSSLLPIAGATATAAVVYAGRHMFFGRRPEVERAIAAQLLPEPEPLIQAEI